MFTLRLQQRQLQGCHRQLGSVPDCDGIGNDKVSFAFAAVSIVGP